MEIDNDCGSVGSVGGHQGSQGQASMNGDHVVNNGVDANRGNNAIDEGLYSRQLYVMGHDAQRALSASNILIIGVNGLGVEIAKNCVLAGVKRIVVCDDAATRVADLGSQFYLSHADIGQPRSVSTARRLAELNEYVPVESFSGNYMNESFLSQFQVVVAADLCLKEKFDLNSLCRRVNTYFVSGQTAGLFASVFCDFGREFTILDTTGEAPVTRMVSSVMQDSKVAIVSVHDEKRHGLETGAYIRFSEVQGMTELNDLPPVPITVKGPYTFEIGLNISEFKKYEGGGFIHEVKQSRKINYKPLQQAIKSPGEIFLTDFAKFGRAELLHFAFQALAAFQERHNGAFPEPGNRDHCTEVVTLLEDLNRAAKATAAGNSSVLWLDDDAFTEEARRLLIAFASGSSAELAPMTAFLGGVIGQEVLKACTGKFTPIHQFLYFDAIECLPDGEYPLPIDQLQPIGSRYDGQIAVFGQDFVRKLNKLNMFLVGAGAIGCEMLKNWALMGISSSPDPLLWPHEANDIIGNPEPRGSIHVTDMDKIERSNLNRQFLFRPSDMGKSKSRAAAKAVQNMNPSCNVIAYEEKCGTETENIFGDDFMASLDVVCTALDNVEARLYVDQRCLNYAKPLLESGTLGTKGNTQVVVPHLTENYGASRDPPEKSIPVCTLKHFPYEVEHCVQWARDWFEGAFTQGPRNVNQYIENPKFVSRLDLHQNAKIETLNGLKKFLVLEKPQTFEDCLVWSRLQFDELYNQQIQQLLYNFPPGMLTTSGTSFWSGVKRQPSPLEFDVEDPEHLSFVVSGANIRAFNYGIAIEKSKEKIKAFLPSIVVPKFSPKSNIKIAATDSELKEENDSSMALDDMMDLDELTEKILSELPRPSSLKNMKLQEAEFDKDNDENFHMDFISSASNLRARNYRISEASKYETKRIAGNIIPAIATTTALVTGLVCVELYKLVQGKKSVEAYKNGFCNLALPFFAFSEPIEVKKVVAGNFTWSIWDKIDIDGTKEEYLLADFLQYFTDKFKVEVNMLSYAVSILHSFFAQPSKRAERMKMTMKELVENVTKKPIDPSAKYLVFEVLCVDENDEDVELPPVRYRIR